MDKEKDPNLIVKIEKAIAEKYGEETIQNPKSNWDEEKEKEYLCQLKAFYKKVKKKEEASDKKEHKGFLVSGTFLEKKAMRTCPVCNCYSFKIKDDVYMSKFDCCFDCYINFVEDREDRWFSGWRPETLR